MNPILQLLTYALIPAAAMMAAGAYATFRTPSANLRSALLHFAGGVVFAVLAIEFLPDLVHERSALATGVGFATGTAVMLGIRLLTEKSGKSEKATNTDEDEPAYGGLLFATAVDIAIDGLMLGIGFAAGAKEGLLLTVALTLELVSLGIAVALELRESKLERRRRLLMISSLALLFAISAGVGSVTLQLLTGGLLVGVIAFGAAALLFLVTEELLTEAHEVPESPY